MVLANGENKPPLSSSDSGYKVLGLPTPCLNDGNEPPTTWPSLVLNALLKLTNSCAQLTTPLWIVYEVNSWDLAHRIEGNIIECLPQRCCVEECWMGEVEKARQQRG